MQYTIGIDDLKLNNRSALFTFRLNNFNWLLTFGYEADINSLRTELILIPDENVKDLSCQARATIKLIPNSIENTTIIKHIHETFNAKNSSYVLDLIDFDELLTNYVYDNEFTVKINVTVGPKYRKSSIDVTEKILSKKFRFITNDVEETYSQPVYLQDSTWMFGLKDVYRGNPILITLELFSSNLAVHQWGWNVSVLCNFVSVNGFDTSEEYRFNLFYVYNKFKSLLQTCDYDSSFRDSYVRNGKLVTDCELKVEPTPLWEAP